MRSGRTETTKYYKGAAGSTYQDYKNKSQADAILSFMLDLGGNMGPPTAKEIGGKVVGPTASGVVPSSRCHGMYISRTTPSVRPVLKEP